MPNNGIRWTPERRARHREATLEGRRRKVRARPRSIDLFRRHAVVSEEVLPILKLREQQYRLIIVEDFAVFGAMTGVHQFVRVGESAFTAGNSMVSKDVPPFAKVAGDRARFAGVNRINLERRGFSEDRISAIKHAFHILFQSKLRFQEACERVERECGKSRDVAHLLAFLRGAERGFIR